MRLSKVLIQPLGSEYAFVIIYLTCHTAAVVDVYIQ